MVGYFRPGRKRDQNIRRSLKLDRELSALSGIPSAASSVRRSPRHLPGVPPAFRALLPPPSIWELPALCAGTGSASCPGSGSRRLRPGTIRPHPGRPGPPLCSCPALSAPAPAPPRPAPPLRPAPRARSQGIPVLRQGAPGRPDSFVLRQSPAAGAAALLPGRVFSSPSFFVSHRFYSICKSQALPSNSRRLAVCFKTCSLDPWLGRTS